ncbi:Hypothetical protein, putative [Bodo saltans]|uniref:Uncharacterized protein n=1 Tax=Bodo saltans TaxID=75058 RepID=A0A0S4KGJ5_BODSA|nr:Hypothetical protein, putative [Bodo saltans]|eukprot:CUI14796.1 Hypothetical protein, putative [Bodo saltans]
MYCDVSAGTKTLRFEWGQKISIVTFFSTIDWVIVRDWEEKNERKKPIQLWSLEFVKRLHSTKKL